MGFIAIMALFFIAQIGFLTYFGKMFLDSHQQTAKNKPTFVNITQYKKVNPFEVKKEKPEIAVKAKKEKRTKHQDELLKRINEIRASGIYEYDLSEFDLDTKKEELVRKRG